MVKSTVIDGKCDRHGCCSESTRHSVVSMAKARYDTFALRSWRADLNFSYICNKNLKSK